MTDKVDPVMAMFTGYETFKDIPTGDNRGKPMLDILDGSVWADPLNSNLMVQVIGVLPPLSIVIVNIMDNVLYEDREEAYDLETFRALYKPAKIVPREG
jgi:hypothetical protein